MALRRNHDPAPSPLTQCAQGFSPSRACLSSRLIDIYAPKMAATPALYIHDAELVEALWKVDLDYGTSGATTESRGPSPYDSPSVGSFLLPGDEPPWRNYTFSSPVASSRSRLYLPPNSSDLSAGSSSYTSGFERSQNSDGNPWEVDSLLVDLRTTGMLYAVDSGIQKGGFGGGWSLGGKGGVFVTLGRKMRQHVISVYTAAATAEERRRNVINLPCPSFCCLPAAAVSGHPGMSHLLAIPWSRFSDIRAFSYTI
ncbi:hypothetical protein QTP88_017569 [Uroleucon formosanum]